MTRGLHPADTSRRRVAAPLLGLGLAMSVLAAGCSQGARRRPPTGPAALAAEPTSTAVPTTGVPPSTVPPTTEAARPPPATTPPPGSLSGRLVVIDAGHNGGNAAHAAEINPPVDAVTLKKPCDTTGTATDDGYTEATYNFDLSQRVADVLRGDGIQVVVTRTSNSGWGPCITERAAIANRLGAAVAISIHADGGPAGGRGFHVIQPALIPGHTEGIVEPSRRLALDMRAAYQAGTGMPFATYIGRQGLDVRSDLGGLNLSKVPKVFIETGNMRNASDARLLEDPSFRARAARALASGLESFLLGR